VGKSIEVVHRFARELRPSLLDDLGLIPALRSLVKEQGARMACAFISLAFAEVEAADSFHRTGALSVAQEALTNVVRSRPCPPCERAHPENSRRSLRLEICDDGKSFPVERMLRPGWRAPRSVGMRERVEMLGGRFAVESAPGKGRRDCRDSVQFGWQSDLPEE